jgi:tetratricopeptide (TPR) repeat protein
VRAEAFSLPKSRIVSAMAAALMLWGQLSCLAPISAKAAGGPAATTVTTPLGRIPKTAKKPIESFQEQTDPDGQSAPLATPTGTSKTSLIEQADLAVFQGDFDRALQIYRYCQRLNPGDAAALLGEARLLVTLDRRDQAKAKLEQSLRLADTAAAHSLSGILAEDEGNSDAARKHFERALKIDAKDTTALARLADLFFQAGQSDDGDRLCQRLLIINPNNIHARLNLAAHLLSAGNTAAAKSLVEAGLKINYGNPQLNLLAGELALSSGRLRQAEEHFKKARDGDPHDSEAFRQLAIVSGAQKNWGGAADYIHSCLELDGGSPDAQLISAWATLENGDALEAKRLLQMLSESFADQPDIHNLHGIVLAELKKYEEAGSEFDKSIKLSADASLPARLNQAENWLWKGDLDKAAETAAALADEFPHTPQVVALAAYLNARDDHVVAAEKLARQDLVAKEPFARAALAHVLRKKGDVGAAVSEMQKAVELSSASSFFLLELASFYMDGKQFDQAVETAQQALQVAPSNGTAKEILGLALAGSKNYHGAALLLKECVGRNPKNLELKLKLSEVLVNKGDLDDAERQLKSAQRLAPDDPRPLILLARVLSFQGRHQEALQLAREAKLKYPQNAEVAGLANEISTASKHDKRQPN